MSSPNPTLPTTDISPWPAGQTTPLTLTLLYDDDSVPALAGATLALIMHNTLSGVDVVGAGVFSAWNGTTAQVTYSWNATSDPVATPGTYALYVKATLTDNTVRIFGPATWTVVSI